MLLALALQLATAPVIDTINADFRACGVDERRVLTQYRDDYEGNEAAVSGSDSVSDEQMTCVARAGIAHDYIITFADDALNTRFSMANLKEIRASAMVAARGQLAELGLLDKLPVFDPARDTTESFIPKLETLCGAKPHSILRHDGKWLSFDMEQLKRSLRNDRIGRQVGCVMAAVNASDLESAGIGFGFIGNEQIDPAPR